MSQPAIALNVTGRTTTNPPALLEEVQKFVTDCAARYRFNSRWDTALNVFGILVSLCIVAAGVLNKAGLAAILGGIVAGTVAAQRAFPFGQRVLFYRNLLGLAENLRTDVAQGLISPKDAVATLKSLRLDFAQQLPRGTTFKEDRTNAGQ
jgi:hypothetical protein